MSADNHIRIRNLSDDDDTARRGGQQHFPPRPSPRNAIIDARAGEGAARKLDDGGKEGCVRIVPTYLLVSARQFIWYGSSFAEAFRTIPWCP